MGTTVGIVYAAGSGIVRRYIYPTDDKELPGSHVGKGEAMLIVEQKVIQSPLDVWVEVSAHLGKVLPSGRCVVTDTQGNVTDVVMADPVLDAIPGKALVASDTAKIGDVVAIAIGALVQAAP